jgi:predicted urease superfamily metal-dependent hydrolase
MAIFFDTHAHLDYPDYANDLAEVVARAQAAGITKIISIGTSEDSSERAVRLTETFPGVYAAVGWHPTEALSAPNDLRPVLRKFARHPKVVAIGETGLDYHHLPSEKPGFTDSRRRALQRKTGGNFSAADGGRRRIWIELCHPPAHRIRRHASRRCDRSSAKRAAFFIASVKASSA